MMPGEGQVELLVEGFEAGQGAGHQAGAVVAAPAGDDLLLPRAAEDVVVIPDQFDVGLVGVGAAEAEVDLGHPRRRALEDHAGQGDRGLGAVADVGVIVGEFLGLGGDRLGDLGAAVADVDAVEAGEGVEQALAVAVLDEDAGAAGDDARRAFAAGVLGEVGRGVEEGSRGPRGRAGRLSACHCSHSNNGMHRRMHIPCTFHARDFGVRSSPVAADVFHLHEGLHAEAGAFAAEAGLLESAEGDRRAGDLGALTATMPNWSARVTR